MLHDLGLRFNSPFVNLWIRPKDFIKICEDPKHYLDLELSFVKEEGIDYPVGVLDGARIYFQHYKTEDEAKSKWNQRKKRIDYNNIYILMTDRDGCTYDDLKRFDAIKCKGKAVFVHKKYKDIKSAVYIPGFENEECVGMCMNFKNRFSAKRYFDAFDYVSWFNKD